MLTLPVGPQYDAASQRHRAIFFWEAARMTQSFTDALQQDRHIVVAFDPSTGRLRVKGAADVCTDLSCSPDTIVVCDESTRHDLGVLNAGDIVRLEGPSGSPRRIVVVRRVWDEYSSPEW
jgi:hypothetical protein